MYAGERDSNGNMRAYEDVEARAQAVPVPAKRGTAILFHNLVFHGSGQNFTNRVRWSLDWRYASSVPRSIGSRRAAKWWLESMSGKQNDYGPIVVRRDSGEEVPGWDAWRDKASALQIGNAGTQYACINRFLCSWDTSYSGFSPTRAMAWPIGFGARL